MRKLDIIVTHYDEPYDIFDRFFTMLKLQRMIDFSEIHVILVQDGPLNERSVEETEEVWEMILYGSPFSYEIAVLSENKGPSAARNRGLDLATAPWICFCDCDDMFANPYALKNVLNVLPTDDVDILNGKFYAEFGYRKYPYEKTDVILKVEHPQSIYIHGKFYRREFLLEHNLRFNENLRFSEDVVFNTQVNLRVPPKRAGELQCEAPIYAWTYREGSLSCSEDVYEKDLITGLEKVRILLPEFKKFRDESTYLKMVARSFYDFYYHPARKEDFNKKFVDIYREYIHDFYRVPGVDALEQQKSVRENRGMWADELDEKNGHYIGILNWLKQVEEEAEKV